MTNPFTRVWYSLTNRLKVFSAPSPATIDKSGVVNSDHPIIGNGWIKGWVVNVSPKNIIIVARHSNPSINEPNNKVFVIDKKGNKIERTIVATDLEPFALDGKTIKLDTYEGGGDIAICRVNEPFPSTVKSYNFSVNPNSVYVPVETLTQDGSFSSVFTYTYTGIAWIKGRKRNGGDLLKAGDSGLPWFTWEDGEWKVITHTTKGQWGEGPWYSCGLIFPDLKNRIVKLQNLM